MGYQVQITCDLQISERCRVLYAASDRTSGERALLVARMKARQSGWNFYGNRQAPVWSCPQCYGERRHNENEKAT